MIHLLIVAHTAASVAGAAIKKENQHRAAAGAPFISDKEQRALDRESRLSDLFFWTWIVIGGMIFTAPFAAFAYAVIKFSFAKQGIEWP